jgi:hypothetical protein
VKKRFTLALLLPALTGLAQTTLTNDGATLTVTSGATLYVAGTVQNNATGTLTNAGTLRLTGDLTNTGTLASPGTLLFSGTTDQTFAPGAATVATLTLDNAGNAGSPNANHLFLTQDLTVGTLLTLVQGLVRTQAPGGPLVTLSLSDGASLTGEQSGRYVQGRLATSRGSVSGQGLLAFPNGFAIDPKGQTLGSVTVTRTAGLNTPGLSYGTNMAGSSKGIDRAWQVVAEQAPTAPTTVSLSWVSDDDNGFNVNAPAQLWRADQASGPWVAQDGSRSLSSASPRTFASNTSQLGVLTVSNSSQPLPVELVSFTAEALGADALLKWATASEKNNDRFEVEASADGRSFRRIGQVPGHGSSTQPHAYQFTDAAIARYGAGVVYYRLRQVDADGTASYSPVRPVSVRQLAGLALFPNPTTQMATLTGAVPGTPVTVLDAVGRLVLRVMATSAGTATLELPAELAAGVYVVRTGQQALRLTVAH